MTSYIDDKLGDLLAELDRLDLADDTIVIFTSDHGDMLGENGMFFKRTFRERSSRVPLVIGGPGITAGRADAPVSLVDLYPTLVELGGVTMPDEKHVRELDGVTLVPALADPAELDARRPLIIENSAEGTRAPTRSVVVGRMKLVTVNGHPDALFDLEADPHEWNDVAGDPRYADALDELRAACFADWDPVDAARSIVDGQRRRTLVRNALAQGEQTRWDFQPRDDATRRYVRTPHPYPVDSSWNNQADARAGGH